MHASKALLLLLRWHLGSRVPKVGAVISNPLLLSGIVLGVSLNKIRYNSSNNIVPLRQWTLV